MRKMIKTLSNKGYIKHMIRDYTRRDGYIIVHVAVDSSFAVEDSGGKFHVSDESGGYYKEGCVPKFVNSIAVKKYPTIAACLSEYPGSQFEAV